MAKYLAIFLLLIGFLSAFFYSPESISAQASPTGIPTCDLCGWCNRTVNPRPQDWTQCRSCLYESSGKEKDHAYYTVLGCFSTLPDKFVQSSLSIVFGIAGGIAFLSVLAGSAIVLTSGGSPEKVQSGREMITNSIIGILVILFSVFLLRVVGLDILKIPGFG